MGNQLSKQLISTEVEKLETQFAKMLDQSMFLPIAFPACLRVLSSQVNSIPQYSEQSYLDLKGYLTTIAKNVSNFHDELKSLMKMLKRDCSIFSLRNNSIFNHAIEACHHEPTFESPTCNMLVKLSSFSETSLLIFFKKLEQTVRCQMEVLHLNENDIAFVRVARFLGEFNQFRGNGVILGNERGFSDFVAMLHCEVSHFSIFNYVGREPEFNWFNYRVMDNGFKSILDNLVSTIQEPGGFKKNRLDEWKKSNYNFRLMHHQQ
jgi:hypothetical protein